jgi:hypothetical protein
MEIEAANRSRRILVVLTVGLLVGPLAGRAQLPTDYDCNGSTTHYPHDLPTQEECFDANPHYHTSQSEGKPCQLRTRNCEGCNDCCEGIHAEAVCRCSMLNSKVCNAGAAHVLGSCRQGCITDHCAE